MKAFVIVVLTAAIALGQKPLNVYLPDSPDNTFIDDGVVKKEWPIIQRELNKLITSINSNEFLPEHFDNVIRDYHPPFSYDFTAMKALLTQEPSYIKELPKIAQLALQIHDIITKRPILLLGKGEYKTVTLNQKEISCLLANQFFCDFPKRESPFTEFITFPHANFFRVMDTNIQSNVEKLKCFFNYFKRILQRSNSGSVLTFERRTLSAAQKPSWGSSTAPLRNAVVSVEGTIEENGIGMLQVDFANKYIGGGILGNGMAQEEVRFSINAELTVSTLFTEKLEDNEVLVMTGSEQFNKYTGYSQSFKFAGDFYDNTPLDSSGRRRTQILAIDALQFTDANQHEQYYVNNLLRELNKAFCGFMYRSAGAFKTPIATGKWGAGAFNGDPMYKFIIQLLAASEAGRDIYMFTHGNQSEASEMEALYDYLKQRNVTVGQLYAVLEDYSEVVKQQGNNAERVESYIRRNV